MAGTLNKVILVGRLGSDPEVKFTADQKTICNMSIATDRYKSDKPDWHRVTAFGKLADICEKFLHKGSRVLVEGSIAYNEWIDKAGVKRYQTQINASSVLFLGGNELQQLQDAEPHIDDDNVPF